ncbi:SDR family oxidoreductase [Thermanaerothrix daxensis]|uniref:SDR family oxidoreductase n=1 Tax=Thermanaerothrix daxensis TaxID=869279 RepID=UPI0006C8EB87|nr:SDR family oxidoreductase [Thermanaerothrix daxensis]
MDLANRVAIITGASGGIGECIAMELARAGVRTMLVGRSVQKLEKVANKIREQAGETAWYSADIREASAVNQMVEATLTRFGRIDILVNAAFWGPPASLEDTTEEFWDQTLDTTLKAPFLCARAVVPHFKKQGEGRIVNIGSLAGKVGEDNRTAYCAAKWGLEGLTAALSEELRRYNIHVHLISPAATNTPWWREVPVTLTPQVIERMIPPEVVAQAVRWVLSLPDQVHVPDLPIYNFRNPFEGKLSPFEGM